MRRTLIAGNWKMNGSCEMVRSLLEKLRDQLNFSESNIDWLVLPPYPYIPLTESLLKNTPIQWGAQNISAEIGQGAFTGEVSGQMLKEFGVTHVLVGHSERRRIFHEDENTCAKKCLAALTAGLTPIFCVGETLDERKSDQTVVIIEKQLEALLRLVDNQRALASVIFGYEPVWAIGTGQSASADQAQTVHAFIRHQLAKVNTTLSTQARILYGGSVKPDNAEALLSQPDIDGLLVGGAALNAEQFLAIGRVCSNS